MGPEQALLYGTEYWLGPLFLVAFLLLVWWLHEGPFTSWGQRRVKRRQRTPDQLREQRLEARAFRLYAEGRGPKPENYDEIIFAPRRSWWRRRH